MPKNGTSVLNYFSIMIENFSKKQIFSNTLENFHTNYSIGRFKGGIPKNV
jgi:hypothetical protein